MSELVIHRERVLIRRRRKYETDCSRGQVLDPECLMEATSGALPLRENMKKMSEFRSASVSK